MLLDASAERAEPGRASVPPSGDVLLSTPDPNRHEALGRALRAAGWQVRDPATPGRDSPVALLLHLLLGDGPLSRTVEENPGVPLILLVDTLTAEVWDRAFRLRASAVLSSAVPLRDVALVVALHVAASRR